MNDTNGKRLEIYAIPGKDGSKSFKVNGASAHRASPGNIITIMSFGVYTEKEAGKMSPKILVMDCRNKIIVRKRRSPLADYGK